MKINLNELSTRNGILSIVIFILGVGIVLFSDSISDPITALLLLGTGVKGFYSTITPDKVEG